MALQAGANTKLHLATETTYGTPPGGNWRRMPFMDCDLGAEQPFVDADVIGLAPNRDQASPFRDVVTARGQIEVPIDLEYTGDWLRLLLGPPTTTGTNPNFVHTFGSGAATLPSASIEVAYPDVPSYDVVSGVRADTLEIEFGGSGPASMTLSFMGQGSTRSATSSAGTPTTRTYTPFSRAQASITRNGTPLAMITSARFSYSNSLEPVRTIRADQRIENVLPLLSRASGQLTARFDNMTLLNDAINDASIELGLEYRINNDRRLTITLHEVKLDLAKTPIRGPGGVEASIEFRAAWNATATRMMTVVLRNGVASY